MFVSIVYLEKQQSEREVLLKEQWYFCSCIQLFMMLGRRWSNASQLLTNPLVTITSSLQVSHCCFTSAANFVPNTGKLGPHIQSWPMWLLKQNVQAVHHLPPH